MRPTILLLFLTLTIPVPSQAQSKTLHQQKSQLLAMKLGSNDFGLADALCDKTGDVFVTVWDPAGQDPADRPLLMFDSAGLLKAQFSASRKALSLSRFEDHDEPTVLLPDGGIARLVWSKDALSLVVFSADGRLQSRTKLDPPAIFPSQIAVFSSGALLVTGLEHVHTSRALGPFKSFTALYDKNGHLLKRLSLPGDAEIDAAAEMGDARYARGPMFGNQAVTNGRIRLGDDGNAYLMRRTSPASVHVISSSGDVVRTMTIAPAETGQMPFDMQVAGDRIALEFTACSGDRCEGNNFTIADRITGQKISDYADETIHGVFVRYSAKPERFSFLTVSEENKLELIEAVAK